MSINRRRGRLSALADLQNKKAEATAAGVDVCDPAAFRAWKRTQAEAFWSSRRNPLQADLPRCSQQAEADAT
jgi:hypothetical protein